MAYSVSGGVTDALTNFAGLISRERLEIAYNRVGSATANVTATNGDQFISGTDPNSIVLVNETTDNAAALNLAPLDANGGFVIDGQYATFITETQPSDLIGVGSAAWIRYEGSAQATIDGGNTDRFLGDATGVTAPVTMYASTARTPGPG